MQFKVLTLILFGAIVQTGFAQQAQSGPMLKDGQAVVETQMGATPAKTTPPSPYNNGNAAPANKYRKPARNFKKEPQRNFRYDQIDKRREPAVTPMPVQAQPLNQAEFAEWKKAVANQSFSEPKMQVVKIGLSSNWVTTEQVRELMQLFSFESSKLELAKLAYEKTVDRNRYYAVNSEFSFSSSVDELTKFLLAKSK